MRILLIALIISALTPTWAFSDTVNVEYGYDGPSKSASLYSNGKLVCNRPTEATPVFSCNLPDVVEPTTFTLTMLDENGVESPASAPYVLQPPVRPTINGITVTYTIEIQAPVVAQ